MTPLPRLAIALAIGLFAAALIVGWGYSRQAEYKWEAEKHARENSWHADKDVEYRCVPLPPLGERNCAIEARREQRKYERGEQDLYAQNTTALWTFLMGSAAILGVGLSVAGVWLVYITYRDHRETTERELRPYVLFQNLRVTEKHDAGLGYWEFAFDVINNGQNPARVISAMIGREIVTGPDDPSFDIVALQPAQEGMPVIPKNGTFAFVTTVGLPTLDGVAIQYPNGSRAGRVMALVKIQYRSVTDAETRTYYSDLGRLIGIVVYPTDGHGGQMPTVVGTDPRKRLDRIT